MNFTFIAGNIGKAESKKVSEDYVIRFSIASSINIKQGNDWVAATEWFNCEYWTKSDKMLNMFKECAGVAVLATRRTSKPDEKVFESYKVMDLKFIFPPKKEKSEEDGF